MTSNPKVIQINSTTGNGTRLGISTSFSSNRIEEEDDDGMIHANELKRTASIDWVDNLGSVMNALGTLGASIFLLLKQVKTKKNSYIFLD